MCEECGWRFCPPACPSYVGRSSALGERIAVCSLCGGEIYVNERFFTNGARVICDGCADAISVGELAALCGFESLGVIFEAAGFVPRRIEGKDSNGYRDR